MKISLFALLSLFISAAAWAGPCSKFDHPNQKAKLVQGPFQCLNKECSQVVIYEASSTDPTKVQSHVVLIREDLRAEVRDSRDREIDLGVCTVFGEAVGYPAF